MRNTEDVPVEIFVTQVIATKPAMQITENWPLKAEVILQVVIKHFHDLGIYRVAPLGQSEAMRDEVLHFLRNSTTIIDMIDKAKKAAALASQRGRVSIDG